MFLFQFRHAEDAKKALEQLNGFELAGRPMKVGHVTERTGENAFMSMLDSDEMDRAGVDLGATGRLHLMAKLAEGKYMRLLDLFYSCFYFIDVRFLCYLFFCFISSVLIDAEKKTYCVHEICDEKCCAPLLDTFCGETSSTKFLRSCVLRILHHILAEFLLVTRNHFNYNIYICNMHS